MASENLKYDQLDQEFSRKVQLHPDQPTQDGNKHDADTQNGYVGDKGRSSSTSSSSSSSSSSSDGPPGGFDGTPIAHAPPGYDVKITFHRATNLPMADLGSLSSDPYLVAQLDTDLPSRHKEDPMLRFRTRTEWKSTNPVWDEEWILANIPTSGFKMKVRIYDEDSNDKDDRLGNVHITVPRIDEKWEGIKDEAFKIKKKTGSKRAYALRAIAVGMRKAKEMHGNLHVSVEVLGRSEGDEGGRVYTIGLNYWSKHKSPLLGRFTNQKDSDEESDAEESRKINEPEAGVDNETQQTSGDLSDKIREHATKSGHKHNDTSKQSSRYNFQANQFQLRGPVPPELYHRYVEFRPIISSLFTSKGLRGLILNKGLHMQHNKVYNFNRDTKYGVFRHPCEDMTRQFLDMVHHDEGGRIFTYVITLDALMRFTETGKEFGIDFLSKHTMHSDASIYIAFSGEFFLRRLKHPDREAPEHAEAQASRSNDDKKKSQHDAEAETNNETHPPSDLPNGPPTGPAPHDPHYYELIIDNDSGTYRPNAALLPLLAKFLTANFPGLKVTTLDCQGDKELMDKLKDQQRELKKKEGGKNVVFTQMDDGSSVSSSDEDELEEKARLEGKETDADAAPRKPSHKLGEALGPLLGNHGKIRKVFGAGGRS